MSSKGCLILDSDAATSHSTQLRSDRTFADVILLVGPAETPVFVHAAILAAKSEYYKHALSNRWKTRDIQAELPTGIDGDCSFVRAVIRHPDASIEIMTLILDYFYSGSVTVPATNIVEFSLFADQLLLTALKEQCDAHLLGYGLTLKNAFSVFLYCDKLNLGYIKRRALEVTKSKMNQATKHGYDALIELSLESVKEILSFESFSYRDKWEFAITWIKASQGLEWIELSTGIPEEMDVDEGQTSLFELLHLIDLFDIESDYYQAYVKCFLPLLPPLFHKMLKAHFAGSLRNIGVPVWGTSANSTLIDDYELDFLLHELKNHIRSFEPRSLKLIGYIEDDNDFHTAVDGKRNTVLVIRTATIIFGAFVDTAWSSENQVLPVKEGFLFSIKQNGTKSNFKKYVLDKEFGIECFENFGPAFHLPDNSEAIRNTRMLEKDSENGYASQEEEEEEEEEVDPSKLFFGLCFSGSTGMVYLPKIGEERVEETLLDAELSDNGYWITGSTGYEVYQLA